MLDQTTTRDLIGIFEVGLRERFQIPSLPGDPIGTGWSLADHGAAVATAHPRQLAAAMDQDVQLNFARSDLDIRKFGIPGGSNLGCDVNGCCEADQRDDKPSA